MSRKLELHGKYGENKFALVDDDDYEHLNQWEWFCQSAGYVVRSKWFKNEKRLVTFYMHREVLKTKEGEIDHINHDKLDNRKSNLRICTSLQNKMNKRPHGRVKGVDWRNDKRKYRASIRAEGKTRFLGYYDCIKDAADAYDKAAKMYFGEFAYLNNLE